MLKIFRLLRELPTFIAKVEQLHTEIQNLQREVSASHKRISGINSTLFKHQLLEDKRLPKSEPSEKSSESSNLDIEKILSEQSSQYVKITHKIPSTASQSPSPSCTMKAEQDKKA